MTNDAAVLAKLVEDHGGPFPLATSHTRVLGVDDDVAACSIAGGEGARIETDFMLLPVRSRDSETLPVVDPDSQLALYIDLSGKLAVMHAATADGVAFSNEWHVLASPLSPTDYTLCLTNQQP